jgi:hypothetical protein
MGRPIRGAPIPYMKKIHPIALTSVDWPHYIEKVIETLGFDPTACLSSAGLDVANNLSYLATLAMDGKPRQNLKRINHNPIYNHIHLTCAGTIDKQTTLTDMIGLDLEIMPHYNKKDDRWLVIMTGSLVQWRETVFRVLTNGEGYQTETVSVFSLAMLHIEMLGYKNLWSGWKKECMETGKYRLRRI